jgi:periplasmic protein TonB
MVAGNVERRSMGALGRMGIVAGMHVAVIFLIARSLGIVPPITDDTPVDVDTRFIDESRARERPPEIQNPDIPQPPIHVPVPEVPPVDSSPDTVISAQPIDPGQTGVIDGPGTAVIQGLVVNARQDARHPLSQPRYPSPDIREGNEGNADVEVYVLPNGRVGDARIARSSGFERLDQSAIEEAKRNWRLAPATRDGVPFPQWYKVRVTFKLTNAR